MIAPTDIELQLESDQQITNRARSNSTLHNIDIRKSTYITMGQHQSINGYRKLYPAIIDEQHQSEKVKLVKSHDFLENAMNFYNRYLPKTIQHIVLLIIILIIIFSFFLIHLFIQNAAYRILLYAILLSLSGMLFSMWLLAWILKFDEGTSDMLNVSIPILEGSEGFFLVQYTTIFRISITFSIVLFCVYWLRDSKNSAVPSAAVSSFGSASIASLTFLFGAFCSALSGYSGMWVSVRTNVRVTSAARRCYNEALKLCFRGGAFSSIINVSLAVGGISICLLFIRLIWPQVQLVQAPLLLVGFGFGASLVAMFAQLGGGIYTKAADVGADLVGKIEAGIPEDDPRNPAVIADLVGDNVGDCAGQCADLFESISAEIISAMILGGSLAHEAQLPSDEITGFVLFPLAVHCMDLVVSSIGIMLVKTKPGLPDADSVAGGPVNPLKIMIRSYFVTCVISSMGFGIICWYFLNIRKHPYCWIYYWGCGIIGMVCAFGFVLITQYYTDYDYSKVRRIAEASCSGPATNIIAGLSVGLESTGFPILLIAFCVLSAYYLGLETRLLSTDKVLPGLFGTAVATMGMLCTAVYVLSMSSFGPIADNAGGIAEMSQQDQQVRAITDRLDAVGNVTKANTKGFSVGSAAMACFLLFSAFLDEVFAYTNQPFEVVDVAVPEVFIGGLIGSCLIFVFCAWSMEAVGRTAQQVVEEVRRQFSEYPGIMDFYDQPDYHTCVSLVSRSALKEMLWPGLLSVMTPIVVGLLFRMIGHFRNKPHLGPQVLAGFLIFATTTGILMALFLNNAGGAWDNAKKYIETGVHGGKGSSAHKAAVVGDTVGDPFKDTAGPSVHVLIKLVSTVALVLLPIFVSYPSVTSSNIKAI